jgi:hypothetical protein
MSALMYAIANHHTSRALRSGRANRTYTAESATAMPRSIVGSIHAWRYSDGAAARPKRPMI